MIPSPKNDTAPSNSNFDLVQELFQGEISYSTECDHCKRKSIRQSNFVELSLNIQNCATILDCIQDLLKDETLGGDNQYFCYTCEAKRDARRLTTLDSLPPILNLQLMRFIYDRTTGHKKKLSTRIRFSEILDLNRFVTGSHGRCSESKENEETTKTISESDNVYHLGAILMHVGKSAYSGHYTAQIKNFQTQEWSNYNDERITKIKKKQQLGSTEEELENAFKKEKEKEEKEMTASGGAKTFSTANAYLLVYYRADWLKRMSETRSLTPSYAYNQSECVRTDNEILERWFSTVLTSRNDQSEMKQTERLIAKEIYDRLWINATKSLSAVNNSSSFKKSNRAELKEIREEEESCAEVVICSPPQPPSLSFVPHLSDQPDFFFLAVETVKQIIAGEWTGLNKAAQNATGKYLCAQHKRLNPLACNRVKLVSRRGLEAITNFYSASHADIGAVEVSSGMCRECVRCCFAYLACKEKLKQEAKVVKQLLKQEFNEESDDHVGLECSDDNDLFSSEKNPNEGEKNGHKPDINETRQETSLNPNQPNKCKCCFL